MTDYFKKASNRAAEFLIKKVIRWLIFVFEKKPTLVYNQK